MTKLTGRTIDQGTPIPSARPAPEELPEHSPLGASSAERWMNCPGSVCLMDLLSIEEPTDEPDYRAEGTAMHEAAAKALEDDLETWELVGQKFHGVEIDVPMADAIEVYVSYCRRLMGDQFNWHVETRVTSPVHPAFYGTVDFDSAWMGNVALTIVDLKGGIGVIVDPEENPQVMYYAFGRIEQNPDWPDDMPVKLVIAQPRAPIEPRVREWGTTVGHIRQWVRDELVPAMHRTALDATLTPGEWCRFCPAKIVCPMLTALFGAAAKADPKIIPELSDEAIGLNYQLIDPVKKYLMALEAETFKRLNQGRPIAGCKLVYQKADRVFKEGAPAEAEAEFGAEAFTEPKLKSPAQLEKVSPRAKEFVKEHAFTPRTGLTVALASDKRGEVKVAPLTEVHAAFAASIALLDSEPEAG